MWDVRFLLFLRCDLEWNRQNHEEENIFEHMKTSALYGRRASRASLAANFPLLRARERVRGSPVRPPRISTTERPVVAIPIRLHLIGDCTKFSCGGGGVYDQEPPNCGEITLSH